MLCNAHYLKKWRKDLQSPQPLKVLRNQYQPRLLHCSIKNCKNNVKSSGLCNNHYMQKWRKANPEQWKILAKRSYKKNPLTRTKYRIKNRDRINLGKKASYDKHKIRLRKEKFDSLKTAFSVSL